MKVFYPLVLFWVSDMHAISPHLNIGSADNPEGSC